MWKHKSKFKGRVYFGSYQLTAKTQDRAFVLTAKLKNGKDHNLSFESWQHAVRDGWSNK